MRNWIHVLAAAVLLTAPLSAQRRLDRLSEGTDIVVRLTERLDSEHNVTGDTFQGVLDDDLRIGNGGVRAPEGSRVIGRLVEVRDAGKVSGRARMTLTLTSIDTGSGVIPVETRPVTVEASGSTGKDAAVVGGTSALGAIIGAIAGGGKGAAIGAAVGAAAGVGGVLVTDGRDVEFEPEQRFNFVLARDAGSIERGGPSPFRAISRATTSSKMYRTTEPGSKRSREPSTTERAGS